MLTGDGRVCAAYYGVTPFDSGTYGAVAAVAMVQVFLVLYVIRAWSEEVADIKDQSAAKKD